MDNKGFESSNFIFGFKGVERNYNSFAIVFIFVIILFFFIYYRREIRAFRSLLKFILNIVNLLFELRVLSAQLLYIYIYFSQSSSPSENR